MRSDHEIRWDHPQTKKTQQSHFGFFFVCTLPQWSCEPHGSGQSAGRQRTGHKAWTSLLASDSQNPWLKEKDMQRKVIDGNGFGYKRPVFKNKYLNKTTFITFMWILLKQVPTWKSKLSLKLAEEVLCSALTRYLCPAAMGQVTHTRTHKL